MRKIGLLLSVAALAVSMLSGCSVQQPSSRQVMDISVTTTNVA